MHETHATNKLLNLINTQGNRIIISITATANCNVLHVQEYEAFTLHKYWLAFLFCFLSIVSSRNMTVQESRRATLLLHVVNKSQRNSFRIPSVTIKEKINSLMQTPKWFVLTMGKYNHSSVNGKNRITHWNIGPMIPFRVFSESLYVLLIQLYSPEVSTLFAIGYVENVSCTSLYIPRSCSSTALGSIVSPSIW